ncbi:monooxygenase [Mycolicibacterium murale]|uniref:Monooxygenase n=1 Tax=Mycolicibacterium murale TaxID=182220 RepID=A0A7I9WRX8_9MYCO|nr:TIGR03560 family F420-dependent LLM class oxidoreductase [Mycolicibacterium murale]MCV7186092.1 TIGR03560 family F420-dependent LLM class oxidoreductase [Mycolicibacterium murale]GFG60319.1 monooxygenase [Mycolicibacterium murale]
MRVSAKLAPTFDYPVLERFWRDADELGFHGVYDYDHFLGLSYTGDAVFEGWTTLAAMAAVTQRARIGCLVSAVTFRNPAVLAKMAVTVDHISDGRLDFGIGAGWQEREHLSYGLDYPDPGDRVAMLDEALTVIRRLWTEDSVSHTGRFFTLDEAVGDPKPVQRPHPPIVIGGSGPKMLQVIARHADEWNMPVDGDPQQWAQVSTRLDIACEQQGRDPAQIQRSIQVFLHPQQDGQVEAQLRLLPQFAELGCQHAVLSFYQPPSSEQLQAALVHS